MNTYDAQYVDLMNQTSLNKNDIRLYMHLYLGWQVSLPDGKLYTARQDELAKIIGCSQPNVSNILKKLAGLNLIEIKEYRVEGANVYSVIPPTVALKLLKTVH